MGAIPGKSLPSNGLGEWSQHAIILLLSVASLAFGYRGRPNVRTSPIAIIFGQPLWIYRFLNHDWILDLSLFVIIGLWINGTNDFKALSNSLFQWISGLTLPMESSSWLNGVDRSGSLIGLTTALSIALSIAKTRFMETQVFAILVLLALMAGAIVIRGEEPKEPTTIKTPLEKEFLLPPLLIPGRTTHTRFFPEKHSFNYSYLSVGIPVGWQGRAGSALSADVDALPAALQRRGWFNINAADYLYRGGSENGLKERLRIYLRGEGVLDEEWTFAYLVTQPRFLGYSFNPVSFWYIYSGSQLKMMILEVNNTFDERRIYLLRATETVSQQPPLPHGDATDEDKTATPSTAVKFSNSWEKDFHVSPFNSRKGTYALTAVDPVENLNQSNKKVIDNIIILKSSKDHPKLVARLFSEGSAKDASTISHVELAIFLARWFWVGFMTFPRIIREASKLYFKRGLHVWFRPEILPSSIGRNHTKTEQHLERFFRAYLTHLITHCTSPLTIHYIPPNSLNTTLTLSSPSATLFNPTTTPLTTTLTILTPAFYTRLPHYSHTAELLNREGLCADAKNRTISISNAAALRVLLGSTAKRSTSSSKAKNSGAIESLRWKFLFKLRGPPPGVAYPATQANANMKVADIRSFPPSGMDVFVREYMGAGEAVEYRRIVTRTFLANRFAGGFEGVLGLVDFVVRVVLVFAGVVVARGVVREGGVGGMLDVAGMVVVNGVHLWSLIKG